VLLPSHCHLSCTERWPLLLCQALLARNGQIAAHRNLGAWAPWLVIAVVASTIWVIITNLQLPVTGSGLPRHAGLMLQGSTTLWFVGLFLYGWVNRHRPDVHKRAMILATITMMAPGFSRISRLFRDSGPPPFDSAFLAAIFIGALVVHDARSLKKVHPVTLWAGIGYLAWVAVRQPIAKSDAWAKLAAPLVGG
jgi:FtsH-binding integral membrane protein